jgi:hypothetical protein
VRHHGPHRRLPASPRLAARSWPQGKSPGARPVTHGKASCQRPLHLSSRGQHAQARASGSEWRMTLPRSGHPLPGPAASCRRRVASISGDRAARSASCVAPGPPCSDQRRRAVSPADVQVSQEAVPGLVALELGVNPGYLDTLRGFPRCYESVIRLAQERNVRRADRCHPTARRPP